MDEDGVFLSHLVPELADGFQKGLAFDVACGAADLYDGDPYILAGFVAVKTAFDLVSDMGNYLDRSAAVIFITASDKRTSKILGLELGADDYITKPFDNKELVLRVKSLWRRIRLAKGAAEEAAAAPPAPSPVPDQEPPGLLRYGQLELDPEGHTASVAGEEVSLTYREFDVLCYLARNRRRVIGRDELLENIWGYSYTGNTRAVDILIKRLRQKLGPAGELIKTVYGVGYRFEVPAK